MTTILRSFVASCVFIAICYLGWYGLYHLGMYTIPPIEEWYFGLTGEWKTIVRHTGILSLCVIGCTALLSSLTTLYDTIG